ncbi:hypothetical protein Tco_0237505 [Tanacetum coccineum]
MPPPPAAIAAAYLTTATPSPRHQLPHHHRSPLPSQPSPRCQQPSHHHLAATTIILTQPASTPSKEGVVLIWV